MAGKRIQMTKSGFESRKEARQALFVAIQEHRSAPAQWAGQISALSSTRWLEEHTKDVRALSEALRTTSNSMFDLQVLAYRAEITRLSTMMYARDTSGATYPNSGVLDGF